MSEFSLSGQGCCPNKSDRENKYTRCRAWNITGTNSLATNASTQAHEPLCITAHPAPSCTSEGFHCYQVSEVQSLPFILVSDLSHVPLSKPLDASPTSLHLK